MKKLSYKKSLERLETIVTQIEMDGPDVDELSKLVKEASELIKQCKNKLKSTEKELENTLNEI